MTRNLLRQLNTTIALAAAKSDISRISLDRIAFGYLFSAISVLTTAAIFSNVMQFDWRKQFSMLLLGTEQADISSYYFALASISCASATAAFGLLGRRRTDDEILAADFKRIGGTAAALPSLLSSVIGRIKN